MHIAPKAQIVVVEISLVDIGWVACAQSVHSKAVFNPPPMLRFSRVRTIYIDGSRSFFISVTKNNQPILTTGDFPR
jgi:hypothetical protein